MKVGTLCPSTFGIPVLEPEPEFIIIFHDLSVLCVQCLHVKAHEHVNVYEWKSLCLVGSTWRNMLSPSI